MVGHCPRKFGVTRILSALGDDDLVDLVGLFDWFCLRELFLGLTPPAGCAVWDQIWEREDLIASLHLPAAIMTPCWSYVGSLRGALLG